MKQNKYNTARVAVDDAVMGRLKKQKKLYKYHNLNDLITDILDYLEYNTPFGEEK